MTDLKRIANALEHLAFPMIKHLNECGICEAKKKPIRNMPPSVVMTSPELRKREAALLHAKMMAGPEVPVADTFRYRELNKERP